MKYYYLVYNSPTGMSGATAADDWVVPGYTSAELAKQGCVFVTFDPDEAERLRNKMFSPHKWEIRSEEL